MMDYAELVKTLRNCGVEDCDCCPFLKPSEESCFIKFCGALDAAADAIEELVQFRDHQRDILSQFGGETGIRQAFERMDDYWRLVDKYNELLIAARKMHLWIFCHTADEQKVYDELGLSDEMNVMLGYSGQIEFRAQKPEEERGCPPDYNPGFCYGDEDCDACWEGWRKEQGDEL